MLQDAAGRELYKREWRGAQRMRAREDRILSNVLRATFPAEGAPHGVASHPSPSYALPEDLRSSSRGRAHAGISLGALDSPGPVPTVNAAAKGAESAGLGVGRYFPGARHDWSEFALDLPVQDYAKLRGATEERGGAPVVVTRAQFAARKTVKSSKHGSSVVSVALQRSHSPSPVRGASPGAAAPLRAAPCCVLRLGQQLCQWSC